MKLTFLLVLTILMSGCTKTVYVTEYVYVYTDDVWTKQVDSAPPPDKEAFNKADWATRVEMMGDAYMSQTVQVGMCNAQLDKIAEYNIRHALEAAAKKKAAK